MCKQTPTPILGQQTPSVGCETVTAIKEPGLRFCHVTLWSSWKSTRNPGKKRQCMVLRNPQEIQKKSSKTQHFDSMYGFKEIQKNSKEIQQNKKSRPNVCLTNPEEIQTRNPEEIQPTTYKKLQCMGSGVLVF